MIPEDLKLAINTLLEVANKNRTLIAGFAFRAQGKDGTFVCNFGNCTDSKEIAVFEQLCEIVAEGERNHSLNKYINYGAN